MAKSVTVLGVLHELQGPGFFNYVQDPSYPLLLKDVMRGIDCVFEEASGRGPSIAEDLAASLLGAGHYIDVDPARNERAKHGIPETTTGGGPIDLYNSPDSYVILLMDAQRLREELWIRTIEQRSFGKAILIVGIGHSLSVAFRLIGAGIVVEEVRAYTPHAKLCRRTHA
jgi:hypothetical protein